MGIGFIELIFVGLMAAVFLVVVILAVRALTGRDRRGTTQDELQLHRELLDRLEGVERRLDALEPIVRRDS